MKKYIVSILVASVFLMGAPFIVPKAMASNMSITDFINLLITIGVIAPDKIPAVNAYLATINNTPTSYYSTPPGRGGGLCPADQVWNGSICASVKPSITNVLPSGLIPQNMTVTIVGSGFAPTGNIVSVGYASTISSYRSNNKEFILSSSDNGTKITFVPENYGIVGETQAVGGGWLTIITPNGISNSIDLQVVKASVPTSYNTTPPGRGGGLYGDPSLYTKCGFTVSSLVLNSKVSFPVVVKGTIDNSQYQTIGCSWSMFEGTAGMAQLYYNYNNEGWKPIGVSAPINVANWTTTSTTFTSTLNFNNGGIGLPAGTPMKIIFSEEDPSGRGLTDSLEFPIVLN